MCTLNGVTLIITLLITDLLSPLGLQVIKVLLKGSIGVLFKGSIGVLYGLRV